MESLKGTFLVAGPKLRDENFSRSVTLMVEHHGEGAMGLVLTQPTPLKLCDVWPQVSDEPCEREDPLYRGGPVEGPLMVLHEREDLSDGSVAVLEGLWLVTDVGVVRRLVSEPLALPGRVRFLAGYAGWGGGQLEGEWLTGCWRALPATAGAVLGDPATLWERLTRMHTAELLGGVNPDIVPDDPSSN